jgi:hypothetical protein
MDYPNWLGDIPTWITTLAIAFGGYQLLIDRKRRAAEEDRLAKSQARKISAWAVTDVASEPRQYGIVVSNRSDSTFHRVVVSTLMHGKDHSANPVIFTVLPPGDHYVQLISDKWDFAIHVDEYEGHLRPYTRTPRYEITGLQFTDNLSQRWNADHNMVLSRSAS